MSKRITNPAKIWPTRNLESPGGNGRRGISQILAARFRRRFTASYAPVAHDSHFVPFVAGTLQQAAHRPLSRVRAACVCAPTRTSRDLNELARFRGRRRHLETILAQALDVQLDRAPHERARLRPASRRQRTRALLNVSRASSRRRFAN
jgi:hypothetical protein